MARRNSKRKISQGFNYVILSLVTIFTLFPIIWIILTSFKENKDITKLPLTLLPRIWTLTNYSRVMVEVQDYGTYYLNSTIITVVSMVIIALLSSFSGYALARFEFPGKRLAFVMNIGLLVIPMEITLVSTFTLLYKYGLLDTKLGLILPYSTFLLFFSTLVMRSAFLNLPSDLEDAGLIDGCSEFRIFWSIAFPLARNSVIFVLINAFIWIWNEFVFASVIASSPASKTLPVAIAEVQRNSGWWDFGQITSAAVLTMAPVIIIFLIFQQHFMKGLMEGAVKG